MSVGYLFRRIMLLLFVMWTAATVNFIIPRLSPRNPILERLQQAATQGGRQQTGLKEMLLEYSQKFGLDQPLWKQYVTYMFDMARLDFGYSISNYPRKAIDIVGDALPYTIALAGTATLIAFVLGTLIGALIAWPKSPRFLRYLVPGLITLQAIPFYLFGLILIYIFAFKLRLLPLSGAYSRGAVAQWNLPFLLDLIRHATLPALAIVLTSLGGWALSMRGLMITVQGEDYITYAEAKGLKSARIFTRYAMRNALLPQVTSLVSLLGFVIVGTGLVEVVFAYPGLGTVIGGAIAVLDYNVIYAITMMLVLIICIATLLMDLIYPLLDPRIKYERG